MYLQYVFCLEFSTIRRISGYSQHDLQYYFLYSHLVSAQILVFSRCLLCIRLPLLQFKLENRITFHLVNFIKYRIFRSWRRLYVYLPISSFSSLLDLTLTALAFWINTVKTTKSPTYSNADPPFIFLVLLMIFMTFVFSILWKLVMMSLMSLEHNYCQFKLVKIRILYI